MESSQAIEARPARLTAEQEIQAELRQLEEVYREAESSPEKALAFLQEAGILDANGDLSKPYR